MHFDLVEDGVRVTLNDETNEGWSGDYTPEDPEDEHLLRFYVERLQGGEWVEVPDASYCTGVANTVSPEVVQKHLAFIMKNVKAPALAGDSLKKICERLSWTGSEC